MGFGLGETNKAKTRIEIFIGQMFLLFRIYSARVMMRSVKSWVSGMIETLQLMAGNTNYLINYMFLALLNDVAVSSIASH